MIKKSGVSCKKGESANETQKVGCRKIKGRRVRDREGCVCHVLQLNPKVNP